MVPIYYSIQITNMFNCNGILSFLFILFLVHIADDVTQSTWCFGRFSLMTHPNWCAIICHVSIFGWWYKKLNILIVICYFETWHSWPETWNWSYCGLCPSAAYDVGLCCRMFHSNTYKFFTLLRYYNSQLVLNVQITYI